MVYVVFLWSIILPWITSVDVNVRQSFTVLCSVTPPSYESFYAAVVHNYIIKTRKTG